MNLTSNPSTLNQSSLYITKALQLCYNNSMIKLQVFGFLLRWLATSIAMFICITWFGTVVSDPQIPIPIDMSNAWALYAVAGLIFSIINSVVKPIIKIFALPLAILTMGISTLVINVVMVIITNHLAGVEMDIIGTIASSLILSIMNSVLNFLIK